ncbi:MULTISPECIES: hypothetical protein [unclassified Frigoribacterium]|uniref:hypothetical protein n=1 Tax=unclassified Frigoribacterium TaxID=2627005 RepID=UPI000F48D1AD|nr:MULTISPECIES: hypothetical protein [unclassified Frigoribacterium]ROS57713.1 hypothetical protein EDF21_1377 [Frigoribacterium sp. PhB118]VXC19479.1 conserved exported hypothetical protein [Frigoribacterium sp. 9N]
MNDTTSATIATRASSSPTTRRRAALAAGLGVAALAVVTLTGCSGAVDAAKSALGAEQVQQRHFDTAADAPSAADSTDVAWFLPAWVPSDARDVDVRLDTQEPGYELSFTSETGPDLAACVPVDGDLGGPALDPATLPEPLPTSGLVSCGDGRVVAEVDGRWASWTTVDAVPGDDVNSTLRH